MANAYKRDNGIAPAVREALSNQAAAMSGDILVNILTVNVTPEPTSAVWAYDVEFELVDSLGRRHEWYNGNIVAAASDDSSAGTAAVDDASPAMVDGLGTVELSGAAQAWLDTEVATLTLNGTVLGKVMSDATFTVTFTAP